jgi:hypothetical protein
MVVGGQALTEEGIERIRGLIDADKELTRTSLSRKVCELFDWRDRQGRLREVHCRVALLKLERRGLIELPPAQRAPFGAGAAAIAAERLELPHIEATLSQLGGVWLEAVDRTDQARSRHWWAMMNAHHPLGGGPLCGAQIRYFVVSRLGYLGGLSFSAPAWHIKARDAWIGWDDAARRRGLAQIINNSRFLILPSVRVPHLASHVLVLALRRVGGDWQARYGLTPVLVETFTDPTRHRGTCYRAANWQLVGRTEGRGRQDRRRRARRAVKEVWLYPLARNWRTALGGREPPTAVGDGGTTSWAALEFGSCALGDQRLTRRLVILAQDFYAQPMASIPQACGGDRAKTKAAYRFLDNQQTTMKVLLEPHCGATATRMAVHQVVLAAQDSTSLNYTAHPATEGLGPLGNSINARGLQLHSTLAMTTDGTPLGFIDAQCWARDAADFGKRKTCNQRAIEDKESQKWLNSYRATAAIQERLPATMVVNIGDREADVYELFALALENQHGPKLLVRAMHNRRITAEQKLLWPTLEAKPVAGIQRIHVPRQGSRAARQAGLSIRFAAVELCRPMGRRGKGLTVWAVFAREEDPGEDVEPLEWMLLTTVPVETFEQAVEALGWYTRRWTIEVLHRILKSGCRIENRQLAHADRLEACLAIDLVVAWRILHLNKLGREAPDLPCTVCFEDYEWKALVAYATKTPVPPSQPPTLRQAIRLTAALGGFLGRRRDGEPGTQTLWLGLQHLSHIATLWQVMAAPRDGTQGHVSRTSYG